MRICQARESVRFCLVLSPATKNEIRRFICAGLNTRNYAGPGGSQNELPLRNLKIFFTSSLKFDLHEPPQRVWAEHLDIRTVPKNVHQQLLLLRVRNGEKKVARRFNSLLLERMPNLAAPLTNYLAYALINTYDGR